MTTFAAVLAQRLRGEAGRPLITYYDFGTGERTELSVTTYANWVAKTASYLAEECDLERGDRIRLDLPTHWLGPVLLGAAWTVGLAVTDEEPGQQAPDAVVCGPDTLPRWTAEGLGARVVIATALHPLGLRFGEPLPAGVRDLGAEVWSQPDAFTAWDPPGPEDDAAPGLTQEAVWEAAARSPMLRAGDRLLTEVNPASPSGFSSFTAPLLLGGSVVLVRRGDPDQLDTTYVAEQATARLPHPTRS